MTDTEKMKKLSNEAKTTTQLAQLSLKQAQRAEAENKLKNEKKEESPAPAVQGNTEGVPKYHSGEIPMLYQAPVMYMPQQQRMYQQPYQWWPFRGGLSRTQGYRRRRGQRMWGAQVQC